MKQAHIFKVQCENCGEMASAKAWESQMHLLKWAFERCGIATAIIEYSDGYELELDMDDVNIWTRDDDNKRCLTIDFNDKGEYEGA